MAWVNDPMHSYVADGTGALCIWAHPGLGDARAILATPGLTGLEVSCHGDGYALDGLWDQVLRGCIAANRPFLWAFASDDTHSRTKIDLSWFSALLPSIDIFALKNALRNGAFYVSTGPRIESIQVAGTVISLRLPQKADVLWMRAGQYIDLKGPKVIESEGFGANRTLRWERDVTSASIDLSKINGWPGEIKFVRALVFVGQGTVAATQPWRVGVGGAIANPYPAQGTWVRGQSHNHTDTGFGSASNLEPFRLAYQSKGQLASFSTDYSYWETPYQWLLEDGTPQIVEVRPERVMEGKTAELVLRGANFASNALVQAGTRRLPLAGPGTSTEVRVILPADLPAGTYDISVTNPDHLRGTLARGFTVFRAQTTEKWLNFALQDGLAGVHSTSVACIGNEVWVGAIEGVSVRRDGKWSVLQTKDGPMGRAAYAILPDLAGGIYIAGLEGIAFRNLSGIWERQKVGQLEKLNRVMSAERWGRMSSDRSGSIWMINRGGAGLAVGRAGDWKRLTKADGIPSEGQTAVASDIEGNIWIGFESGLYKRAEGTWMQIKLPAPLNGRCYVSAIGLGLDGGIWAAVSLDPEVGGVVFIRGTEVKTYLSEKEKLPSSRIRSIHAAKDGSVWFASDKGITCLNSDRSHWKTLNSVNSGLVCDLVLDVAEDVEGNIWCATAAGVSCLLRQ